MGLILIVPYEARWPQEFQKYAARIRGALGSRALRIDHIGSTAVPGLAAKDVIDAQITVERLDPAIDEALTEIGYVRRPYLQDHVPPGAQAGGDQWSKWVFQNAPGARRVNVHVRLDGRANQRYALLFRDYLRSNPLAAQAYGQVKTALARLHADDLDAYYDVKDPVCDIIMAGAEAWAAQSRWQPGPSDA